MNSFVLTERPWIPCERLDGSLVELSTRDVLCEAHALRGIVDSSPLVVAVLHRHVLAVLHRAYDGPKSMAEWSSIARGGKFEVGLVEAYLMSMRDRMDLFHPDRPFAQTKGLLSKFADYVDPIRQIEIDRSAWGSASSLFSHEHGSATMLPARACRALLSQHAFAVRGLIRKPNEPDAASAAPLVNAAVVILIRPTLFHTLMANLMDYRPTDGVPVVSTSSDQPSWEAAPLPLEINPGNEQDNMPTGWLNMLTWLSRRIELQHDGNRVTGWVRAVGVGRHKDAPRDPMLAYRESSKHGFVPLGLSPDRVFWRDAEALFAATQKPARKYMPPQTVAFAIRPAVRAALGANTRYHMTLCGQNADQSKVEMSRRESLSVLSSVLCDPSMREAVVEAVSFAELCVEALQAGLRAYALASLTAGDRKPDAKAVTALVNSLCAEPSLWSAFGEIFQVFLDELAEDADKARLLFEAGALRLTRIQFASATTGAAATGGVLKAQARGELKLNNALSRIPKSVSNTANFIVNAV
jgi:CRISPR system Cascade subunit CasA